MKNLNRERKSSEMISSYYREELVCLFKAEFGAGFIIIRTSEKELLVRYPLTNTWFRVCVDVDSDIHWHIIASNCRQFLSAQAEFTTTECADYIKRHRYGNAMAVYYSYA